MAKIVLGIGVSHSPVLNGKLEDWSLFIEGDRVRGHRDKAGHPATYDDLLERADPDIAARIGPDPFAARHAVAVSNLSRIRAALANASLNALIVVGGRSERIVRCPKHVLHPHLSGVDDPQRSFGAEQWRLRVGEKIVCPLLRRDRTARVPGRRGARRASDRLACAAGLRYCERGYDRARQRRRARLRIFPQPVDERAANPGRAGISQYLITRRTGPARDAVIGWARK